jgi:CubicO group peptidase (beta-lactamase class C family)
VAASARLQAAVGNQISAGAPGVIARIEAPGAGLVWTGSAGRIAREESRSLRPDDAFRIASVTKNVTAAVAVRLAHEGRLILDDPLDGQLDPELLDRWPLVGALCREYGTSTNSCPKRDIRPPGGDVGLDRPIAQGNPRFASSAGGSLRS